MSSKAVLADSGADRRLQQACDSKGPSAERARFVFIDASNARMRTVRSARRELFQGVREAQARESPICERKLVIYNINKDDDNVLPVKLGPTKAALRKLAVKIVSGFSDRGSVDYCLNNLALFEKERPSVKRLAQGFEGWSVNKALGVTTQDLMGKGKAAAEFDRILHAERNDPSALLDNEGLIEGLRRIRLSAQRALSSSKAYGRLKAK